MTDIKTEIERFVDEVIANRNYPLLDILWTFSYSIPSKSAYHDVTPSKDITKKALFEEWLERVCKRNLQLKYKDKSAKISALMKRLLDFKNENPDFLPKEIESFYEHIELFKKILFEKSAHILSENINKKLKKLSNLDKKALSFLLNYMDLRIEDSIKNAEKKKQEIKNYTDKYDFLLDMYIKYNKETGKIEYYELKDIGGWNYIFNSLLNKDLKEDKFKVETESPSSLHFLPQKPIFGKEYSFWQFGDKIVNLGIGYWAFDLSSGRNIAIKLMIPGFVYESINGSKEKFPKLTISPKKLDKIKDQYQLKQQEEMRKEKLKQIEELKSNKRNHRKVKEYIIRVYEK